MRGFLRSLVFGVVSLVLCLTVSGTNIQAQGRDQLTVGFTVDPQTLDPRVVNGTQVGSALGHIFETLVFPDERGVLHPKLAERWEVLDPRTIRFHLRNGVRFHNGDPFDASAVKFSIESRQDPELRSPQTPQFAAIDRVVVVDQYTVDLKLNAAAARSVLRTLGFYYGMIAPPRMASERGIVTRPIGTGPYRFVEYRPGERLVVERAPGYWGRPPSVPRIVFRVIPEPGTRVAALERGEIDIAYNFPIDQIARVNNNPELFVFSKPTIRIAFLGFRVDRPLLADVRVRRALAMAIDRPAINASLLGGRGRVANTVLAPEVFGYSKKVDAPEYDPSRARQLLAEAGQSGLRLRLGLSNGRFLNDRQIGEAVGAYLEQVGVRTELDAPEFGTFFREVRKPDGKYDAYVISWATNTLDPDFTMRAVFHERFSPNYTSYKSADITRLIDQAQGTVDEKVAQDLYIQIQDALMRDLPWVPMVLVPDIIGASRKLEGLKLRADELIYFWSVTKK